MGMSPGTFLAAATVTTKVLKWVKISGIARFVVGAVGAALAGAIGRVAWCIGYGALNKGVDIKASLYPWEAFISASVR